jgi:hypothetical protein
VVYVNIRFVFGKSLLVHIPLHNNPPNSGLILIASAVPTCLPPSETSLRCPAPVFA